MKLELNVVKFANEDVIATSGVCPKTIYEFGTAGPEKKHAAVQLTKGLTVTVDGKEFTVDPQGDLKHVGKKEGFVGMLDGDHLAAAYVTGKFYHYDADTKAFTQCTLDHE